MEKRSKSLLKNTMILSFGNFCTKGIMFIMTPLFTRWLSQADYGTFDLILTYISLIVPLATLESSEIVFRYLMGKKEDEYAEVITNSSTIFTIGVVIYFLLSIIAYWITKDIYLSIIILVLAIVEALNTYTNMMLRGMKKINLYTISNIVFCISMVTSVSILVKGFDLGLKGILLGYAMGYLVNVLVISLIIKPFKYLKLKCLKKDVIKKMLRYSIPLIPTAVSWWILNVSDRTIVSIFLGTSMTAILAVANKIPNICQTVFQVFHFSWQQSAIETKDDEDKVEYYNKILNQMLKILCSIVLMVMSVNFLIFGLLFEEEYFLAYYQSPILMLAIIVSMLCQFIGGIYIANMESKKNGITTIISSIINIIVHLMLINIIGLYAATLSTLISYIILFILRYYDIRKTIKIRIEKDNYKIFIYMMYLIICIYLNIKVFNFVNLILTTLFSYWINRNEIKAIIEKILAKVPRRMN